MKCPNCNHENDAQYAFCLICGEQLPKEEADANAYLNPKLEQQRKKQVTALAKLYIRTATKMAQPTIQRFDTTDQSLTPQALLEKVEMPVLEKMAAMNFDAKKFRTWLIISGAVFVVLLATSVILCLPYMPLEYLWYYTPAYEGAASNITNNAIDRREYFHYFNTIIFVILCIPTILLTGASVFMALRLGKPQYRKITPLITAELARRASLPEEQEETACQI